MIVDLDELDLGELFEVRHQRTRDRIQRAVRHAVSRQVNIGATVREHHSAIACETVTDHRQPLIALHVTGPFEEFIEHRIDDVLRRRHIARHRHLIRQLAGDQALIVREVHLDFPIERCARGGRDTTRCQRHCRA